MDTVGVFRSFIFINLVDSNFHKHEDVFMIVETDFKGRKNTSNKILIQTET